jgi:hypothetical protein
MQAREDVGEPSLRIDVVELGGLDQRVDCGGAVGDAWRTQMSSKYERNTPAVPLPPVQQVRKD